MRLHACAALRVQDLPGALTDAQVAEGLGLTSIKNRDWFIVKTSAIKVGEGGKRVCLSAACCVQGLGRRRMRKVFWNCVTRLGGSQLGM